jgi:hypothetical protein
MEILGIQKWLPLSIYKKVAPQEKEFEPPQKVVWFDYRQIFGPR